MAMDRKRFNLVTDVDGVFVYAPIPIKTTAALLSRRFKMPEISIFDTFPTYPIALLGGAHTFRAELSRRRHEGRKPKPESVKGYNEFTLKADRHKVELRGAVGFFWGAPLFFLFLLIFLPQSRFKFGSL